MSLVVLEPPLTAAALAEAKRRARLNLVTEDDEPVDNLYCDVQQRLFVEPLGSWTPPPRPENPSAQRPFLAHANLGLYRPGSRVPLVPDVFISLDVTVGPDWPQTKEPRCYFIEDFGKPPEVVVEIVSNKIGHELGSKLQDYARIGARYYVICDAWLNLGNAPVRVYELVNGRYRLRRDWLLPEVGLSIVLWRGTYQGITGEWYRWCDLEGNLLLTGRELAEQEAARAAAEAMRAEQEATRAEQEATRAEQEATRARQEAARADRLAAQLRALGVEPETG